MVIQYVLYPACFIKLIKVGLLDEAAIILDDCIKDADEKEKVELIGLKASVLADMGRYGESIQLFNEISVHNPIAVCSKGMVYLRMDRYKEALECFEEYLKIDPNDKMAKVGKGMVAAETLCGPRQS